MANQNIHPSPEFLNELDLNLRCLFLLIEVLKGLTISMGDIHAMLSLLLRDARYKR